MRTAHLSYGLILGIALAGFAALARADTAAPQRVHKHRSQVHQASIISSATAYRAPSSVFYVPSYLPSSSLAYPRTAVAAGRSPQRRSLFGVTPLVDPAAGVIDRKAWSWRPMLLGIAPAFPAYAADIRALESPALALDGATFLADQVVYRLRGLDAPSTGEPGAYAARKRLETLLASGERVVVYPVGLDHEQRMLADAVLGGTDLASLLRPR